MMNENDQRDEKIQRRVSISISVQKKRSGTKAERSNVLSFLWDCGATMQNN
jgi:hypothetical protein